MKVYATVLQCNIAGNYACIRVRINGVCTEEGVMIPEHYPNNTLCKIAQLTLHFLTAPYKNDVTLKDTDIAVLLPQSNVVFGLTDGFVTSITPEPMKTFAEALKHILS